MYPKFYIYFNEKSKSGKANLKSIKYDSKSGLALNSDRTFLNMLEQSPAFLLSLWMHAVFVSIDTAAFAGWIYIAFRAIYPLVFPMGPPWLFLSTFPNYAVIMYFCVTTLFAVHS